MRSAISETFVALVSTLAFLLVVLPIFYIWIPYEIVSSMNGYSFKIGGLRYSGICFIVLGAIVAILCSIGFIVRAKGSPIPFSPTKD